MPRLRIAVTCAICPVQFFPWCRKRVGAPTCSVRCARILTGRLQRGRVMTAALAGKARKLADEATYVGQRFGSPLTAREVAIYRYGVSVGVDRGYRQRKAEAA